MTVDIISTPAISSTNAPSLSGKPTMSSREIAALTGKTHKNVIRDIVIMIDAIHKDGSDLSHQAKSMGYVRYKDARGYTSSFDLDQDLTYNLVLGYDAALRLRVVQRWMELESGKGTSVKEAPKRPRKPSFDTTYTRLLKIARTLPGFDENQQCLHAARGTFNMTGVNPLEIMGVTSIAAPNNDAYLTATEIGKEIGLSAMAVNKLLIVEGYQVKVQASSSGSDYQATEKGAPFGRMFDTTRKGGKGSQATLKWSNRIVKRLRPFAPSRETVT
ncbi:regulatory protein [Asaia sp. SF2.1]|nr:regulatory protein [Asaia sp. SF2.1]